MDLFETSSQFNQILRTLVPQMQSLLRAAHFALKHSESEDYLFYAIMDLLDDPKVELNTKLTVFQFIDVLIHESFFISQQTNSHYNYPYIHNLKTQLPKIILKVLPGTNNANLFNIFNNLKSISESLNVLYADYVAQYKSLDTLLSAEELESVDMDVPYPEIDMEVSEENLDPVVQAWELLLRKRKQSHYERLRLLKHQKMKEESIPEDELFNIRPSRSGNPTKKVNEQMLSKKQILARMEDDRETHKKSKETLWVVNRPSGSTTVTEDEFSKYYWDKIEKLPEPKMKEFLVLFDELNKLAAASYKDPIA